VDFVCGRCEIVNATTNLDVRAKQLVDRQVDMNMNEFTYLFIWCFSF